jgi:hypothetical protein
MARVAEGMMIVMADDDAEDCMMMKRAWRQAEGSTICASLEMARN